MSHAIFMNKGVTQLQLLTVPRNVYTTVDSTLQPAYLVSRAHFELGLVYPPGGRADPLKYWMKATIKSVCCTTKKAGRSKR